jgi:hypothetical protein
VADSSLPVEDGLPCPVLRVEIGFAVFLRIGKHTTYWLRSSKNELWLLRSSVFALNFRPAIGHTPDDAWKP